MDINSRYKQADHGFTKSGTHENQFYGYCNQKKDIYYLRKLLQLKPGLNETVLAGLPADCEIQSDKPFQEPFSCKKAKRHFIDQLADGFKVIQQMDGSRLRLT